MQLKPAPEAILVAVDFSPCSVRALETALTWRSAAAEVTLLHVLDQEFLAHAAELSVVSADELQSRMRERAEDELSRLVSERGAERVETMIVVGDPFIEIVKIANDLECDLVVIGIHGRTTGIRQLLFGGTAEKVLRGASRPVLCVP